jgi:hypothetical protein
MQPRAHHWITQHPDGDEHERQLRDCTRVATATRASAPATRTQVAPTSSEGQTQALNAATRASLDHAAPRRRRAREATPRLHSRGHCNSSLGNSQAHSSRTHQFGGADTGVECSHARITGSRSTQTAMSTRGNSAGIGIF